MTSPTPSSILLSASLLASSLLACSSAEGDGDGAGGQASGGSSSGGTPSGGAASGGTSSGGLGAAGATGGGGSGATGGTGTGGTTGDSTIPTDTSQAGLETWLAGKSYQSDPWVGDEAPRESTVQGNPHGNAIRAYYNPTAMASIMAGTNGLEIAGQEGNPVGSMAVKEFYDESGTMEGVALFLRTTTGSGLSDWTYYCRSESGLCSNPSVTQAYGAGAIECSACHGGVFYSEIAQAAAP